MDCASSSLESRQPRSYRRDSRNEHDNGKSDYEDIMEETVLVVGIDQKRDIMFTASSSGEGAMYSEVHGGRGFEVGSLLRARLSFEQMYGDRRVALKVNEIIDTNCQWSDVIISNSRPMHVFLNGRVEERRDDCYAIWTEQLGMVTCLFDEWNDLQYGEQLRIKVVRYGPLSMKASYPSKWIVKDILERRWQEIGSNGSPFARVYIENNGNNISRFSVPIDSNSPEDVKDIEIVTFVKDTVIFISSREYGEFVIYSNFKGLNFPLAMGMFVRILLRDVDGQWKIRKFLEELEDVPVSVTINNRGKLHLKCMVEVIEILETSFTVWSPYIGFATLPRSGPPSEMCKRSMIGTKLGAAIYRSNDKKDNPSHWMVERALYAQSSEENNQEDDNWDRADDRRIQVEKFRRNSRKESDEHSKSSSTYYGAGNKNCRSEAMREKEEVEHTRNSEDEGQNESSERCDNLLRFSLHENAEHVCTECEK